MCAPHATPDTNAPMQGKAIERLRHASQARHVAHVHCKAEMSQRPCDRGSVYTVTFPNHVLHRNHRARARIAAHSYTHADLCLGDTHPHRIRHVPVSYHSEREWLSTHSTRKAECRKRADLLILVYTVSAQHTPMIHIRAALHGRVFSAPAPSESDTARLRDLPLALCS